MRNFFENKTLRDFFSSVSFLTRSDTRLSRSKDIRGNKVVSIGVENFLRYTGTMNHTRSSFDAAFLETQKKKLEEEQARLKAELDRIAKKDTVGDDYHATVEQIGRAPDDNVVEEEQYEAARSIEQSLELQLRDVTVALQRMVDGSYGLCATCREPIDLKRLDALPSARTCRKHAE